MQNILKSARGLSSNTDQVKIVKIDFEDLARLATGDAGGESYDICEHNSVIAHAICRRNCQDKGFTSGSCKDHACVCYNDKWCQIRSILLEW